ncbi:hypothetical protein K7432_005537 [Basidiobolus ranarum]|uniref:Uncharacterized protein n=1 Tax=Basidiobolus ranarum TaxID=34480 RepID=A0ABR2WWI1_9FUNG
MTSTEETTDYIPLGSTGIYKKALEQDIRALLLTYQKKQSPNFESFSETWSELNFSLIHFGCTEKNARELFMNAMYQLVLDYFDDHRALEIKLGILYALYLLYYTQPETFPKVGIRVTLETWKGLWELYQLCGELKLTDGLYIFHRMKEDGAFIYVAWLESEPRNSSEETLDNEGATRRLYHFEKEILTNSMGGISELGINNSLGSIASRYGEMKRKIINTDVAHKASARFYRDTLGVDDWKISPLTTVKESLIPEIGQQVRQYQAEKLVRLSSKNPTNDSNIESESRENGSNSESEINRRAALRQSVYDQKRAWAPGYLKASTRPLDKS